MSKLRYNVQVKRIKRVNLLAVMMLLSVVLCSAGWGTKVNAGVGRTNNTNLYDSFGAQGTDGWYFGTCEWNGANFTQLTYDSGLDRYYNGGKPELKRDFVEPGNSLNAAYKWVAAENGRIKIEGEYVKYPNAADSNANGVCLRIFHNLSEKKWIGGDIQKGNISNNVSVLINEEYDVKKGDEILFAVNSEGNDSYDGGKLSISIKASTSESTEPSQPTEPSEPEVDVDDIVEKQLFPKRTTSYVGDPMPFYDNGEFHIFYLEDIKENHGPGFHPWALYETSNFHEYEDKGAVIPFTNNDNAQDMALGTGSVIKGKDGLYHAFYTGHNTKDPSQRGGTSKEAIMHATSTDMVNWTKIAEDTFYGDRNEFKCDYDFRDPYVLYVEEQDEYWMLITTRKFINGTENGVIAKYTSKNLKNWTNKGVFFVNDDATTNTNLECPSLLKYKDKWYLTFSNQWGDKQFQYRVSDSVNGPFVKKGQGVIDGTGFYAGRIETDGNRLYAFGWNGRLDGDYYRYDGYLWAGNLVVHQLEQQTDGSLVAVLNQSVKQAMNKELALAPIRLKDGVKQNNNNYTFTGNGYEYVEFNPLYGSYLFETSITNFEIGDKFGFAFGSNYGGSELKLVFDTANNKLQYFNKNAGNNPQSQVDMNFRNVGQLNVSMLIGDGVVSVYVNNQCALTARIEASQGTNWCLFGNDSAIQWKNVKIYKGGNSENVGNEDVENEGSGIENVGSEDIGNEGTGNENIGNEGEPEVERTNNTSLYDSFGEQGNDGWYFGTCEWNGANFTQLTYDAGNRRYFNNGKPELKRDYVEPGNGLNAAYKWVAAKDGKIKIEGEYIKYANASDYNADGVCLRIFHNLSEKKWIGDGIKKGNITTDVSALINEEYEVKAGDEIIFAVNPEGNDSYDGGKLSIQITSLTSEPSEPVEPSEPSEPSEPAEPSEPSEPKVERTNNTNLYDSFGAQGNNGWYFGVCEWNARNFAELTYDAELDRYYNSGKPELKRDYVEPGNGLNAAYKWVAAEDGIIKIEGEYVKYANAADSNANGVCIRIFHNLTEKKWIGGAIQTGGITGEARVTINEEYEVKAGDEIIFAVNPEGNDSYDGGRLSISISSVSKN